VVAELSNLPAVAVMHSEVFGRSNESCAASAWLTR
jgi:hypothetical protein